jgi:hypothetical protein
MPLPPVEPAWVAASGFCLYASGTKLPHRVKRAELNLVMPRREGTEEQVMMMMNKYQQTA